MRSTRISLAPAVAARATCRAAHHPPWGADVLDCEDLGNDVTDDQTEVLPPLFTPSLDGVTDGVEDVGTVDGDLSRDVTHDQVRMPENGDHLCQVFQLGRRDVGVPQCLEQRVERARDL